MREPGVVCRWVIGALLVVGVGWCSAASASAAGQLRWSAGRTGAAGDLIGVACPARTLCVGVNNAGGVAVSKRPSGGAQTWKLIHGLTILQTGGTLAQQIDAAQIDLEAYDVSCPSVHLCLIGRPGAANIAGAAPSAAPVASIVYTTDPLGGASAWHTVNGIDGNAGLIGSLSCPSTHLCFAIENKTDQFGNGLGTPLVSTDPTGGASAWKVAGPDLNDYFQGISCPSTALCVAAGGGGLYWTKDPAGPTAAWKYVHSTNMDGQIDSVSCPSKTFCIAQPDMAGCKPCGAPNDLISTDPIAGDWRQASVATGYVSCATKSWCVGAGGPGRPLPDLAFSTDPAGRADAWRYVYGFGRNVIVRAVSCASTSFCVAVGDRGLIAVGQPADPKR